MARDQIMSTSDVFSFRSAGTSARSSNSEMSASSPTSRMQPADSSSGSGAPTQGGTSSSYKVIQQNTSGGGGGFAASSSTNLHHHHHHHHLCFDGSIADDEVTELPSCAYASRSSSTHMQQHYLNLAGTIQIMCKFFHNQEDQTIFFGTKDNFLA